MLGVVNFLITSTHTGAKGQVHFIYDLGEETEIKLNTGTVTSHFAYSTFHEHQNSARQGCRAEQ